MILKILKTKWGTVYDNSKTKPISVVKLFNDRGTEKFPVLMVLTTSMDRSLCFGMNGVLSLLEKGLGTRFINYHGKWTWYVVTCATRGSTSFVIYCSANIAAYVRLQLIFCCSLASSSLLNRMVHVTVIRR